MEKVVLIKFGEIFIRGKNRSRYFSQLMSGIKRRLPEGYVFEKEQGRFVISSENMTYETVLNCLKKLPGITSLSFGVRIKDRNIESIQKAAVSYLKEEYSNDTHTFKVESKRSDKNFPWNSKEISREVGGFIDDNLEYFKVNVINPEITVKVEIRSGIYIYSKEIKTFSGLPYGSSGSGVLMLSGGIDSPIAGFLMAKRGVKIDAVYFESPPYTSVRALEKVLDLAGKLTEYTIKLNLHIVNFTEVQKYIKDNVPNDKMTLFLKKSMLKVSEKIAVTIGASGIITGDSVGQVASQTMASLFVIDKGINLPIIRPLAGYNKDEIVNLAKELDTYEISIRPYEDCCTVFVPEHPDLRPKISEIEEIEKNIKELDILIENAFLSRDKKFINLY